MQAARCPLAVSCHDPGNTVLTLVPLTVT